MRLNVQGSTCLRAVHWLEQVLLVIFHHNRSERAVHVIGIVSGGLVQLQFADVWREDLRVSLSLQMFEDEIPDVTGNLAWANDNRTLFYSKQDPETPEIRHDQGGEGLRVLVRTELSPLLVSEPKRVSVGSVRDL